ncbi:MAG: insulinase family protein [Bacteroidales bacterium]|nr:insulinase family protein [Bacteroidales bacterium]
MFHILVGLAAGFSAVAQPLFKDPDIREGKLSNGLTYYIRHNATVEGLADFYLALRVGSVLEDNDQRGLAHFLEHMAFNGSEHFPDGNTGSRSIHNWCERNGIKFGADLNASTSIERTLFNISNAPVSKAGVADTCLLILNDWSHALLLRDDEIDNERNVIHEEWRTRRSTMAVSRIIEEAMPIIYKGTKYADCLPIGSMEVVDNFQYDALRRFYRSWYRPDLQAVVVVGDVDVDSMEQKIRQMFSSIPMPADASPREYYPVADNDEMVIFSRADNEQPTLNLQLFMKRDASPRNQRDSREAFVDGYKSRLALFVVRQRLQQLTNVEHPLLVTASARDGIFYMTEEKDAFSLNLGLRLDNPKAGIDAAMEVVMKARRFGITEAEFEHAKMQFNVNLEHRVDNKNKTHNSEYVGKIISHFCSNAHLMSIEQEADLEHELMDNVTIEEVNETLRNIVFDDATGKNQVVLLYGPSQHNGKPYAMPSDSDVKQWILDAQRREYANDIVNSPVDRRFIKKLPKKGKIVDRSDFGNGYTKYVLSNGINVYARPSELEPNRLTIKMFREGGAALYPDEDVPSIQMLENVIARSGAADFDFLTLEKKRAGKALRVTPFFGQEEEGIEGVCAASDLKTWLEVAYLYVTQPRKDKDVYGSITERKHDVLVNRTASPKVVFNDSLRQALYVNPQRTEPLTLETLHKVSHDRIMDIYKERFSDMTGMSLIVTGDIRMDDFEDLICQYVASLPGRGRRSKIKTEGLRENYLNVRRGNNTTVFDYKQETPSALTQISYFADMPYTAANDMKAEVLAQILRTVYTETIREKLGGTYGVQVSSRGWSKPDPGMSLTVSFRCDPERYESLLPAVEQQLKLIADNGPTDILLKNVKEYEHKYFNRIVISNGWWEYVCYHMIADNIDYNAAYLDIVDSLTPQDIQQFCQQILASNNRVLVTMK